MNANKETICHILPCSIDQNLTAPIPKYFQPTPLPIKSEADTDANATPENIALMAAQFRGRGLLCATDSPRAVNSFNDLDGSFKSNQTKQQPLSELPSTIMGVVLDTSSSYTNSTTNTSLQETNSRRLLVMETFTRLYDWQHEHDITKIRESIDEKRRDKVGLRAVLGWSELAHAIHDPIPVPPQT